MTMTEKAIAAYLAGDLGGVRAAFHFAIVESDELDDGPGSERTMLASYDADDVTMQRSA